MRVIGATLVIAGVLIAVVGAVSAAPIVFVIGAPLLVAGMICILLASRRAADETEWAFEDFDDAQPAGPAELGGPPIPGGPQVVEPPPTAPAIAPESFLSEESILDFDEEPPRVSGPPGGLWGIGIIAFLLGALVGATGVVLLRDQRTTTVAAPTAAPVAIASPTPAPTVAPTPTATPATKNQKPVNLGESIILSVGDNVALSVTAGGIADPAEPKSPSFQPKGGHRLVGIQLRIGNVSTSDFYDDAPANGAVVVGANGDRFEETGFEITAGDTLAGGVNIPPEGFREGYFVFEVPTTLDLRTFELTPKSGTGPETGIWNLV